MTYKKFLQKLKSSGVIEIEKGKGSERHIGHKSDIDKNGEHHGPMYSLKCHGEGCELGKGTMNAALRVLKIPSKKFWSK
jgi:hypothetical protein